MINIAILGYGVVGSGVAEVCRMNNESIRRRAGKALNIKKILDLREFPDDPLADRITHNADDIINDPEIAVVVETIGGAGFAYEMSKRALSAGKHVVTSNKELVARHGPELMALAHKNSVNYLFEASVGGGIPIIRPLHKCLAANEIESVIGILNGTTNYILTRMEESGISFEDALAEAQKLGFAEQNPAADIEGIDACRKIAILGSIAFAEYIDSDKIHTEGISSVTVRDMKYASKLGCKVKLLASLKRRPGKLADIIVAPMLLPASHPVAVAQGVFNAILVNGNALGEAMFYGQGAGKLPTASAVVADVIECMMHLDKTPHDITWNVTQRENVVPHSECSVQALVRINKNGNISAAESLFEPFGMERIEEIYADETAYRVGLNQNNRLNEQSLQHILSQLRGNVVGWIRFYQG
ncbi:MAG: homoserine dehydrogenase [Clostridiaceae bacterium]|nr:homoserine dehydrogenase [Clostridiaceae bacterium]